MNKTILGLLSVLFAGMCDVCAVAPALGEGDTFEHRLSRVFSEVCPTNGSDIALRMMDRDLPFRYGRLDADGHNLPVAGAGTLLMLGMGEKLLFLPPGGGGYLSVAVTNELDVGIENRNAGHHQGPFVLFDWHFNEGRRRRIRATERFVVDVGAEECYDGRTGIARAFKLPFRSIWRDWDDYMENHSGHSSAKRVEAFRQAAEGKYRRLVASAAFSEYCRALEDDHPHAVLFRWSNGDSAHGSSILAVVRRRRGDGVILSAATFGGDGMGDELCVYGENGLVRQRSFYRQGQGGAIERHFEFDREGKLSRFAELDGNGRELPRRNRSVRAGEMVPPDERSVFLDKVRGAIRPLVEAWRSRSFEEVFCSSSQSSSARAAESQKTMEHVRTWQAGLQAKIDALNARRRSAGLPDMTEIERARFLRDDALKVSQDEFEKLRHQSTGRMGTTDMDSMVDRERARLHYLGRTVSRRYPVAVGKRGARPDSLRTLLSVRIPPHGVPLLPEGEQDIVDSWGHAYRYRLDGDGQEAGGPRPIILSAGPDGRFETADDLSSDDWHILQRRSMKLEETVSPSWAW